MARWTVQAGDDQIVVETTAEGLIRIDTGGPVLADRKAVEDLRAKLGAAITDTAGDTTP